MQKVIRLLSFFLLSICLYAQDKVEGDKKKDSLSSQYIVQDIQTSTYYDLVSMLKKLKLPTQGDINTLKIRLLDFYEKSPESFSSNGKKIIINKAAKSRYFKVDEKGEKYLSLEGGVSINIQDSDGSEHKIIADSVIYNQSKKLFSAKGNVKYTHINNGNKDTFFGDYLSFSFNQKDMISLKGYNRMESDKKTDSSLRLYGKSIVRNSDDIIILTDAIVTKSRFKIPAYSIRASRIWILNSKEWGLENGFFYIGEVPVFYIGFFFYPGQKIVFHPNFGTESVRGSFIQTTTYISGQQEKEDIGNVTGGMFSFFESEASKYKKKLEGLHLVGSNENASDKFLSNKLKLMIDGYTRMGFFTGLKSSIKNKGILKDSQVLASIGFSKLLYGSDDDSITDKYIVNGKSNTFYKNTTLGNTSFPFRFGVSSKQDFSYKFFSLQTDFNIFSDTLYENDFLKRYETFQWEKLLGLNKKDEYESSQKSTLTQKISMSLKPDLSDQVFYPYISTLSLTSLEFRYIFYSKTPSSYMLNPYQRVIRDDNLNDFYYPYLLVSPAFQIDIAGTLYKYPAKEKEIKAVKSPYDSDFISPFLKDKIDFEKKKKEEEDKKKKGTYYEDLESDYDTKEESLLNFKLSYSITTYFENQLRYISTSFKSSRDLILDADYRTHFTKNTTKLMYNLDYFHNFLVFSGSLTFQDNVEKTGFFEQNNATKIQQENQFEKTYANNSDNLLWTNNLSLYFLNMYPITKDTKYYYNISNYIYKRYYTVKNLKDEPLYKTEGIRPLDKFFPTHNTGILFDFKFLNQHYYNDLNVTMPPKSFALTNKTYFDFSSIALFTVDFKYFLTNELLEYQLAPVNLYFRYKYPNWLIFSQKASYNFEDKHWQGITSRLDLWKFYFISNVDWTDRYDFDKKTKNFVLEKDEDLRLKSIIAGINLNYVSPYYYKNRLAWGVGLDMSYNHNFIKISDIYLNFKLTLDFYVYKFLSMTFSIDSKNSNMFLYYKSYTDDLGVKKRSFFKDLWHSLEIGNKDKLEDTYFRINKISFTLNHDMLDWSLIFKYEGVPKIITKPNGVKNYEWDNYFTFLIQWNDFGAIKKEIEYKDKKLDGIDLEKDK